MGNPVFRKILMTFRLSTCERNCSAAPVLLPCCPALLPVTHKMCVTIVAVFVVNNFPFLSAHTHRHTQHCECVLFIVPVDDSLVDRFIYVACAPVLTVHAHNAHLHIELSHALHTNTKTHTHTDACLVMWQLHSNCNICRCCFTASAVPAVAGSFTTMAKVAAATATGSATWQWGNNMSLKQCSSCALNYQGDATHTQTHSQPEA